MNFASLLKTQPILLAFYAIPAFAFLEVELFSMKAFKKKPAPETQHTELLFLWMEEEKPLNNHTTGCLEWNFCHVNDFQAYRRPVLVKFVSGYFLALINGNGIG